MWLIKWMMTIVDLDLTHTEWTVNPLDVEVVEIPSNCPGIDSPPETEEPVAVPEQDDLEVQQSWAFDSEVIREIQQIVNHEIDLDTLIEESFDYEVLFPDQPQHVPEAPTQEPAGDVQQIVENEVTPLPETPATDNQPEAPQAEIAIEVIEVPVIGGKVVEAAQQENPNQDTNATEPVPQAPSDVIPDSITDIPPVNEEQQDASEGVHNTNEGVQSPVEETLSVNEELQNDNEEGQEVNEVEQSANDNVQGVPEDVQDTIEAIEYAIEEEQEVLEELQEVNEGQDVPEDVQDTIEAIEYAIEEEQDVLEELQEVNEGQDAIGEVQDIIEKIEHIIEEVEYVDGEAQSVDEEVQDAVQQEVPSIPIDTADGSTTNVQDNEESSVDPQPENTVIEIVDSPPNITDTTDPVETVDDEIQESTDVPPVLQQIVSGEETVEEDPENILNTTASTQLEAPIASQVDTIVAPLEDEEVATSLVDTPTPQVEVLEVIEVLESDTDAANDDINNTTEAQPELVPIEESPLPSQNADQEASIEAPSVQEQTPAPDQDTQQAQDEVDIEIIIVQSVEETDPGVQAPSIAEIPQDAEPEQQEQQPTSEGVVEDVLVEVQVPNIADDQISQEEIIEEEIVYEFAPDILEEEIQSIIDGLELGSGEEYEIIIEEIEAEVTGVEAEPEPEVTGAEAEVEAEVEVEIEVEPELEAEVQAEVEVEAEMEPEVEVEQVNQDQDTDVEAQTTLQPDQGEPEQDLQVPLDSQSQPNTDQNAPENPNTPTENDAPDPDLINDIEPGDWVDELVLAPEWGEDNEQLGIVDVSAELLLPHKILLRPMCKSYLLLL